jgi:hypothetical protein
VTTAGPPAGESWGRAARRAIPLALWVSGLLVLSVVTVHRITSWRDVVTHYELDLDPRPRAADEMFPDAVDDVPRRIAEAKRTITEVNREFLGDIAVCAAIWAGLVGLSLAYRRAVPRARRATWPATKRAWLLAVPLVLVLAAAAGLYCMAALGGALHG